jgi:hypothetical protein
MEAEPYCIYEPPAWKGECSLDDAVEQMGVSTSAE